MKMTMMRRRSVAFKVEAMLRFHGAAKVHHDQWEQEELVREALTAGKAVKGG